MRKLAVMVGMMLIGTVAFAQRGGGATPEMRAERQTQMMAERLDLSEEQQKQVYALQLDRMKRAQTAREGAADPREEMRAINQEYQKNLGEVLTAEQNEKLKVMQDEMREGRRGAPEKGDRKRGKKQQGPR